MQNPVFTGRIPSASFVTTGIGDSGEGEQVLNVQNVSGHDITIRAGESFQVPMYTGLPEE
ncbi:hypothetical protein ABT093_36140 [Kitasatospora sp. NPDC002551]|uniref:hypothetical protein n=1 Tax=Kitasatospora sp. NPDC002551 TaxID=3154539 RepID=UPI0033264E38